MDFLTKIQNAGGFGKGKSNYKRNIYFHGTTGGGTTAGSTLAIDYTTDEQAAASLLKATQLIINLQNGKDVDADLRDSLVTVTGISPASATAGFSNVFTVAGTGFVDLSKITITLYVTTVYTTGSGIVCSVNAATANAVEFKVPSSAAAVTYDLVYSDTNGNAYLLVTALTLNP